MSDDLRQMADGFRLGTAPSDDDVSRANWIIDRQSARIEELEAENVRLREALEDIERRSRPNPQGNPKWINDHARAALQEEEQKEPFSEYGHYGENNPPVGMSSPGDKDYEV